MRTSLQQLWAELSEKIANRIDPAIKYGGGPENIRTVLLATSDSISSSEIAVLRVAKLLETSKSLANPPEEFLNDLAILRADINNSYFETGMLLKEALDFFR